MRSLLCKGLSHRALVCRIAHNRAFLCAFQPMPLRTRARGGLIAGWLRDARLSWIAHFVPLRGTIETPQFTVAHECQYLVPKWCELFDA